MPPKKKGGKKKKASGDTADKGEDKEVKTVVLPTIPQTTAKTAFVQHAVASAAKDPQVIGRLVQHYNFKKDLVSTDINGTTPLMIAAKRGDYVNVVKLLSYQHAGSTNVDACELIQVGGLSALHHACAGGHVQVCEALLQYGANPDLQSKSALGETPLHICCKVGEVPCAKILLANKAKPGAIDKFGNNASFWANSKGHGSMIKEIGLPGSHSASPDELFKLMSSRIPGFSLPKAGKQKKKKGGKKKK